MTQQGASPEQLRAQVLERAQTDQAFRQELIQNPRQALSESTGLNIPDTIQIEVLEETPTQFYLVLPPAALSVGGELSSAELEGVAGGWSGTAACSGFTYNCNMQCTNYRESKCK